MLTNVGLDHQDWLGDSREAIGREKAGVFRARRPAVLVEREPPQSVLDAATVLDAPKLRLGRDFDYEIGRSEEHTSELQSLMRISYAVFCLKKKKDNTNTHRAVNTQTTMTTTKTTP